MWVTPHICVRLTFNAKPPLAQRQLLFEVPSLRFNLHQQSDFAFLELIWGQETRVLHEFSRFLIFGVPTRTLTAEILIENKFSGASAGYSRVRNEKIYRASLSKRNSIREHQSYAQKCRSNVISVVGSLLMHNQPWRKDNYSTRYLLYESCVKL